MLNFCAQKKKKKNIDFFCLVYMYMRAILFSPWEAMISFVGKIQVNGGSKTRVSFLNRVK